MSDLNLTEAYRLLSQPAERKAVIKTDAETLALWREAMVGKNGAHTDNVSMKDAGNSRAYTVSRWQRAQAGGVSVRFGHHSGFAPVFC